jgi:hypothetical protein
MCKFELQYLLTFASLVAQAHEEHQNQNYLHWFNHKPTNVKESSIHLLVLKSSEYDTMDDLILYTINSILVNNYC